MRDDSLGEIVEAVALNKVLAARKNRNFQHFLVTKASKFIERIIGTPLLIQLPDIIKEFGIDAEEPLRIVKSLYDRGFILTPPRAHVYQQYPDEPKIYFTSLDKRSSGVDFFDPTKALWRALGEYIERELWGGEDVWFRSHIQRGPASAFGSSAIDLQKIAGFSDALRVKLSELNLDKNSEFGWIPVTSVSGGETKMAPVQLFSAYYWHRERGTEPMLRGNVTTGLATGQTLEEAVLRGGLEVLERDAFMISYLNRLSPPQIDLESLATQDSQIASILESFKRSQLELHILLLPSDFSIPIVSVAIIDRTGKGPALSIGAKADFNLREAIVGALAESLAVRLHLRGETTLPEDFPKNKINREERLQYWIPLKRLPLISFLLKGPLVAPVLREEPSISISKRLAQIGEMLKKNECEMFYVELFSKNIRELSSLRSAYVMSPQLQPLHLNEGMPHFGGDRLKAVPNKLGLLTASTFNPYPHPFP